MLLLKFLDPLALRTLEFMLSVQLQHMLSSRHGPLKRSRSDTSGDRFFLLTLTVSVCILKTQVIVKSSRNHTLGFWGLE